MERNIKNKFVLWNCLISDSSESKFISPHPFPHEEAMLKKYIAAVIITTMIVFFSVVAQAAQTLPFTDTANRPANIIPDTVIATTNYGMWVVTDGSYYSGHQATESIYVYQDGLTIKMSFLSSGLTFSVIEMPDPAPIVATANRPANIIPDTVIAIINYGMWVVTDGSYYSGTHTIESVCIYQYGSTIKMSFLSSGVAFSVIEMPDPAPIVATTNRPANMYPGTVLFLSNGQIVKVTAGSYYSGATNTEEVILYLSASTYILSFKTLGVAMDVEILTDTGTTYSLSVSVVGTGEVYGYGINCGSNCSEVLKSGTYIELTGNVPPNSWDGCDSSSETTCYVTMDVNKNVTAVFSSDALPSPISLPSIFQLLLQ